MVNNSKEPFTVHDEECVCGIAERTCGFRTKDDKWCSIKKLLMCDTDFSTSAVVASWINYSAALMIVNRLWFAGHCSGWWNDYDQFLCQTSSYWCFTCPAPPLKIIDYCWLQCACTLFSSASLLFRSVFWCYFMVILWRLPPINLKMHQSRSDVIQLIS